MESESLVSKPTDAESVYDVIIVGAGIAGASLAASLASCSHLSILLLERDWSMPDRIVGECLQPGGVHALNQMGLGDCLEGIDASPICGYAVFLNGKDVCIPYPAVESKPGQGRAFHHGKFVQNLRARAKAASNVTTKEAIVTQVLEEDDHHQQQSQIEHQQQHQQPHGDAKVRRIVGVVTKSGERFCAKLTIICDGPGSMLRNRIRTEELKPMIRSHFAAVLLEGVNHLLPYPNHGHVVLSDAASPFLMYPIAERENHCRALIDVPAGSTMEEIEHHLRHTIAPILPVQLRPAFLHALDVRRVRSMPNREMPGQPYKMRGALLLGDAFNCRHPLTGGGMTVALSDVLILSNLLKKDPNLSVLEHGAETLFSQFYSQRKALSSSINILASALYSVFADPAQRDLREACFQYFQRGGQCVAGPMGLLGGLTPGLGLLVWHFTRVAFVGVGCARSVLHAASMLKRASGIIVPLLING